MNLTRVYGAYTMSGQEEDMVYGPKFMADLDLKGAVHFRCFCYSPAGSA